MTAALAVTPREARTDGSARRHHGVAAPVFVATWLVAAGSVDVIAHLGADSFGYAATSTRAALVVLAAGLGLVAAGTVRRLQDPHGAAGPLSALLSVGWLAASWVAWTDGPPVARSAAMIVAAFSLPLLFHLTLVLPRGSVAGWRRSAVVIGYLSTAVLVVGRSLVLDPFRDRYCWDNCGTNPLLVHNSPELARAFEVGWRWLSAAIGSAVLKLDVDTSPESHRRVLAVLHYLRRPN